MPTIDIAQVIADFGAIYNKEGQTEKQIKTALLQSARTDSFFKKRPMKGANHYKSVFASVDAVLQAFGIPVTNKGGATFKPHMQKLGEFKIDDLMEPDRFRNSYLGFLAELEKTDRTKWNVLKWYIMQLLIPRALEQYELECAYYGWEKTGFDPAPTVDGSTFTREFVDDSSALPANAAVDGIRTQIQKFVADGRATVINTGALSADPETFCDQVEAFVDGIEKPLMRKLDYIFMSVAHYDRYIEGRRLKYNLNYEAKTDLAGVKHYAKLKVQGLESMEGSEKIWASPAENRILPTRTDLGNRFDVQKEGRAVQILNDWSKVAGFEIPEFVVTNDQENTITAAETQIGGRYYTA